LTSPTANGAFIGNGFEVTPSAAYADAGLTAQNIDGNGDSHLYYNYGLNIPTGATIKGIEVRLDWYLDSDNGTNGMSVDLSWNGGLNWAAAQTDYAESTAEHTATLGGPADSWNRAWNPGEFSNANFRVRVTCASDDPSRDFYLDWVPVSIYYAPLAWLEVTGNSSMTAGDSNQLTVTARDNEGNVAVNYNGPKILIFSGPGAAPGGQTPTIGGVPVGNSISLAFADGVSVATLVAYRAETTTINVSDGIINSTGHGLGLTVNPAAASQLDLTPDGGPATSGVPFTVTVTALDAYGNVAVGYAGTVVFSSSDTAIGVVLPSAHTFTPSESGIHAFTNSVTLLTSGNQDVTVADTLNINLTDTETWLVGATLASRLEVTGTTTMMAGSTNELTITAKDSSGNIDTTYNGPKSLIFSGPGIAPGGQTPTIALIDIGVATPVNFTSGVSDALAATLIAYRAEITTIDVSDVTINSTGYGLNLTVNPATTSRLDLTPDGEPATSGTPFTVTVTAQDAYNNIANGYANTVAFSSSDNGTGVVLPLPYIFTASDNGTRIFTDGVTLVTSGDQTLTAADGALYDNATWHVGAAASANRIVISPAAAAIIAGDNVTYTVEAFDQFNNSLGDVTGSTLFSILPPNDGGSWTANVYTSQFAGIWTVTGSYTGILGTASLTVAAGSVYSIVITPDSSTINAGNNVTYTAEAFDQSNNSLGDVTTSTTFSIDPLAGGSWINNVYTSQYSGTWTVTGNYSGITDTDLLTVSAGTAVSILIIPDTATIAAGESITYTVEAIDQFNNSLSDATATTIFSIDPLAGGGWINNVYTSQYAGTWAVTGDCDGIVGAASLTVGPGALDHFTVTSDNYTQETSIAFTVTVTAYDAYENIMTTDNSTVVTMTSSSPTMIFDGNDNGLFGEPGDNVKTLSSGTFDIQAKDNAAAEDVIITASVGGAAVETSATYSFEEFRCFIATAAYGTPMAEEIQVLRDFRDKYLSTNPPGRLFVSLYYKLSPPVARFIAHHDFLRACIRFGLMPVLWLATAALKTTLAQKLAILSVLLAATLVSIIWLRRTRKTRPA
jgi:hypothetical protein